MTTRLLIPAAALFLLAGCSKPPPPPKVEPTPPPPPPPANIKLEDLSQELHVDARVQVAPNLEVGPDQGELGKAIIKLAEALAKGDDAAMASMLSKPAQTILEDLKASEGWQQATSKIESVRVVGIGTVTLTPPAAEATADASGLDAGLLGGLMMAARTQMTAMMAGMPPEQQEAMKKAMESLPADGATPEQIMAFLKAQIDALKTSGAAPPELIAQIEAAVGAAKPAEAPKDDGASDGPILGVLFAVQDPAGAYLVGWGASEHSGQWIFTNAPTNRGVRARASEWDGIGEGGFGEMSLADNSPRDAAAPGSELQGTDPNAPSGSAPADSPSAPNRKNTPAGPITIPSAPGGHKR